jgi:hypothetical protein
LNEKEKKNSKIDFIEFFKEVSHYRMNIELDSKLLYCKLVDIHQYEVYIPASHKQFYFLYSNILRMACLDLTELERLRQNIYHQSYNHSCQGELNLLMALMWFHP